jgi:Stress responsive A/B Barrel Domain
MIRHIVAFRLAGAAGEERAAAARELTSQLESLVGVVPTLRHLEVGTDFGTVENHWHAVLVTEFDSVEDLDAYQAHPEQRAVVGRIDPLVADRAVVDYG